MKQSLKSLQQTSENDREYIDLFHQIMIEVTLNTHDPIVLFSYFDDIIIDETVHVIDLGSLSAATSQHS